jgi:hypothetical protein
MNKFDTYVAQNRLDLVRRTTVVEGYVFSRLDTKAILEQGSIRHLDCKNVCEVRNINRAWNWVCSPKVYGAGILEELHSIVSEDVISVPWLEGTFRTEKSPITISCSTYVPPLTTRLEALREFESKVSYVICILRSNQSKESKITSCLQFYIFLMKRQYFIDANKRTAYLFVNSLLRDFGLNVILLLPKLSSYDTFNLKLKHYYEGDDKNGRLLVSYIKRYYIVKL